MQRSDLNKFDLPDVPGVYLFKKGRMVLYVGKATSLRDRVRSYFDDDLIATRGARIVDMVTAADKVSFEPMPTVLEALVREAVLIKQYQPKANVEGKDDKTFLYTVITDEVWPRVLMVRGKDIDFTTRKSRSNLRAPRLGLDLQKVFGPFPSGPQLKEALRLIRKIFPFYDTPKPVTTKSRHIRTTVEFNRQIGQYPRTIDEVAYRKSIRRIALFFAGQTTKLHKTLAREMAAAIKDERFEDAAEIRRELYALGHMQDVSLIKEDRAESMDGLRIEAYDTAHLSGTNAIGVMVVFKDGIPSKKEYRTFSIRGIQKNDDISSLKEILLRRLAHQEWEFPNVIVVDGGKLQKTAAESVLTKMGFAISVAAVIKDERHHPREVLGACRAGLSEADIVLANAEAHRFSLSRHRLARSRSIRTK